MTNNEIYTRMADAEQSQSEWHHRAGDECTAKANFWRTLAAKEHDLVAGLRKVPDACIAAMADDGMELDVPEYEDHDTLIPPAPTAPISDEVNEEEDRAAADLKSANHDLLAADILRALRKVTEPQTIGQVAMVLGSKPDAIRPALVRLVGSGVVEKSGFARGTKYAIKHEAVAAE